VFTTDDLIEFAKTYYPEIRFIGDYKLRKLFERYLKKVWIEEGRIIGFVLWTETPAEIEIICVSMIHGRAGNREKMLQLMRSFTKPVRWTNRKGSKCLQWQP